MHCSRLNCNEEAAPLVSIARLSTGVGNRPTKEQPPTANGAEKRFQSNGPTSHVKLGNGSVWDVSSMSRSPVETIHRLFFFFLTGFRSTTNESWSHQPTFPQSYWKLVTNASIAVQRGKRSLISRFLATLIGCSKMTDKKESGPIQSLPSLTRRSLMKDIGVHYG